MTKSLDVVIIMRRALCLKGIQFGGSCFSLSPFALVSPSRRQTPPALWWEANIHYRTILFTIQIRFPLPSKKLLAAKPFLQRVGKLLFSNPDLLKSWPSILRWTVVSLTKLEPTFPNDVLATLFWTFSSA